MTLLKTLLRVTLGSRLPTVDGVIGVRGLHSALEIRRDASGIAYVDAKNEDDAWFGLGFAQAQDRAFQLEVRLRTVRGTLSALFGEPALSIDRLCRRLGFVQASEAQVDVLDDDVRAQIEAFVRGLNAGLVAGATAVAPEFALLRSRPSEWRAADVLGMAKLISFLLIGNWDVELTRLKLLLTDGPEALRDLDPTPYPPGHVSVTRLSSEAVPAIDALGHDLEALQSFAGMGSGSNAWAVAGSKTASGRPLLANDPHLEGVLPAHWYLAGVQTPDWHVVGASMVGLPGFGVGHNGALAWGITASLADTSDLFIEELGPDETSVRRGERFEPCRLRREVIEVRGKAPVVEDVLVTPHGPIISPALHGDLPALSLRAVWLDARPIRGFTRLHRLRSREDVRREFEHWPLLTQNLVYADTAGNIGWQLVGEVPVRSRGYGTLPIPAAGTNAGWAAEYISIDALPGLQNPPAGFVATANNQPFPDGEGPYLGSDWLDGYRAGRISEALAEQDGWDVASSLRLQMDVVSLPWRELRDIILALDGRGPDASLALTLLRDWDGRMTIDSAAATVFSGFLHEMASRIAHSRAPRGAEWALGKGFTPLLPGTTFTGGRASRVVRRLIEQPEGWFPRGWQAEMSDALASVVASLRERFGGDVAKWGWGHVRPLTLEHPLGAVKALAPVFSRGPFPWGGDGNTVSQAGGTSPMVIASLRAVIPVGDWDAARFVLPGGQSGNPFSPHYDDMLPLWQRGEGVAIAWSRETMERATRARLRLRPLSRVQHG